MNSIKLCIIFIVNCGAICDGYCNVDYGTSGTVAACFARVCVGTGKKHGLTRETG